MSVGLVGVACAFVGCFGMQRPGASSRRLRRAFEGGWLRSPRRESVVLSESLCMSTQGGGGWQPCPIGGSVVQHKTRILASGRPWSCCAADSSLEWSRRCPTNRSYDLICVGRNVGFRRLVQAGEIGGLHALGQQWVRDVIWPNDRWSAWATHHVVSGLVRRRPYSLCAMGPQLATMPAWGEGPAAIRCRRLQ